MSRLSRFFSGKSKDDVIDGLRGDVKSLNLRLNYSEQSHFDEVELMKKHFRESKNEMRNIIAKLEAELEYQRTEHGSDIAKIDSSYLKKINEIETKHEVKMSEMKKSFTQTVDDETTKIRKSIEKEYSDKLMELESEIEFLKGDNESLTKEISENSDEYFDALGKYEGALTVITAKDKEIERLNAIVKLAFGSLPQVSATIKTVGDNTVNVGNK